MSIAYRSSIATVSILACALVGASFGAPTPSAAYQRQISTPNGPKTVTSRLKSLLVSSFFYNYNHQIGIPMLVKEMKDLGAKEGWTVDEAKAGTEITAAKLANYQVFFGNYISSLASKPDFGAVGRAAVQDFVENKGGGFFIMHATGDSRLSGTISSSNWPWFFDVAHPTIYVGEGTKSGQAPVFIPTSAKTHPVLDGFKWPTNKDTVIFHNGEWHQFSKNITVEEPKVEILMKMDNTKNTDAEANFAGYNIPGGYPCSWTFPAGKGRIGYFMEAHDTHTPNDFTQPVWDKFWTQFMYYMAGYDTTGATAIGPKGKDANYAIAGDGITFHPQELGVFVSRPGNHIVALFDMQGRMIKEYRGSTPTDYNFSDLVQQGRSGVYLMRVAAGSAVKSKRFFVQ